MKETGKALLKEKPTEEEEFKALRRALEKEKRKLLSIKVPG